MRTLTDHLDAEHRTRKGGPFALSLLVHGLLLIVFWGISSIAVEVAESTGGIMLFEEPGGGGGGGGGTSLAEEIEPTSDPVAEQVAEVEVIPIPEVVALSTEVVMPNLDSIVTATASQIASSIPVFQPGLGSGSGSGEGPGEGGGSGGGSGGGVGTGIGTGRGPGRGVGNGRLGAEAQPRGLVLPPNAPRGMRGKTVTLQLTVDATGVVRDVQLIPETGDGDFDKALRRTAMQWLFRPGTDATGKPVLSSVKVVFTF